MLYIGLPLKDLEIEKQRGKRAFDLEEKDLGHLSHRISEMDSNLRFCEQVLECF